MTTHRLRLAIVLAALTCASVGCGSSTGATTTSIPLQRQPAGVIVSHALSAAAGERSVKWVSHTDVSKQQMIVTSFAGVSGGYQTMKLGSAQGSVVFSGSTAYLRGSAVGLQRIFGFKADAASGLANRWISWSTSDAGYDSVSSGLTIPSIVRELGLHRHLRVAGVTTLGDRRMIKVRGTTPKGSTATLYIALDGPPLPVEMVITGPHGQNSVTTFSHWGTVRLRGPTPTSVIAVSALS